MQGLFEITVQIKQKRGIGVENPSPRSFSGGKMCDGEGIQMRHVIRRSDAPIVKRGYNKDV